MPRIHLSFLSNEEETFANGAAVQPCLQAIIKAMEAFLHSNGIRFEQPDAGQTELPDLAVALDTAVAPPARTGAVRGARAYYSAGLPRGRAAGESMAVNYKRIYPDPSRVKAIPATALAALRRLTVPGVVMELGYRDNPADSAWMAENIQPIARNLVQGITQFLGLPFVEAQTPRQGEVTMETGHALPIRRLPNTGAAVLGTVPDGETVVIWGQWGNWYVVEKEELIGYAPAVYIQ